MLARASPPNCRGTAATIGRASPAPGSPRLRGLRPRLRRCRHERVVVFEKLPAREVRARVDGNEVPIKVALPQLEVELLERADLGRTDVADRVSGADVLRARADEGRCGSATSAWRFPRSDDAQPLRWLMIMPKPLPSRPANVISPLSIASAAVIGGMTCVVVPFGVPIGQLSIASVTSRRGYARSTPRRSRCSSSTTGARPLIAASGHTRGVVGDPDRWTPELREPRRIEGERDVVHGSTASSRRLRLRQ